MLIQTTNREQGLTLVLDALLSSEIKGQSVFIKPNFNSSDPFPGSTHPTTLQILVSRLKAVGVKKLTVGDRSGMGNTRQVMEDLGVLKMADELGFATLVLDELDNNQWESANAPGSHWSRGFPLPRPVLNHDFILQTCCLKTHRFGGHFTLSLKNSVGLVAKRVPGDSYNYMSELHRSPNQRKMIAEINVGYTPDLIIMDAMKAFVDGGPDRGKTVEPNLILAATDRVALDAVGVAILRYYGTTPQVSEGPIFKQEQIARASELGLGVRSAQEIELVSLNEDAKHFAEEIQKILLEN